MRTREKRQRRAFERVANNPGKYLCATFADRGAALLAKAMIVNPDYNAETMAAMNWTSETTDSQHRME